MKQKLLDWIYRRLYGYDPKVQRFLAQVAKKYDLPKKDYATLFDQMTNRELSDFLFLLRGCPVPDEVWNGVKIFYDYNTLSSDRRAVQFFETLENKIEFRRKQVKKQKFAAFDWDNLVIDENSFRLSCEKKEMGVLGNCRFDIRPNQIDGFPTHYLLYSLIVHLNGEDVLLDDKWHEGVVCICTNEEETKWLKKHRTIVSLNPYAVEPPEALFKDDYHQQRYDNFQSLPLDTKDRIKAYLCGVEDDNPEKNQFENPELIKPILSVLVYNSLLQRKLELDRQYVAERIKKEHLKERMYYRLMARYLMSIEKQRHLDDLYRKYHKTSE